MFLKMCACCIKPIMSHEAIKVGRAEGALYLDCPRCGSTVVLLEQKLRALLPRAEERLDGGADLSLAAARFSYK